MEDALVPELVLMLRILIFKSFDNKPLGANGKVL